MASLDIGKPEVVEWIKQNFRKGETCFDVGACDGKWSKLLSGFLVCDGIEIFAKNIIRHDLMSKYRHIVHGDIRKYQYDYYDLIIFGDVLEHMTVQEAQEVLRYAIPRCRDLIVAVPFQWVNRSHYGNKYEIHIQDDLTPKNVLERYEGIKPLFIFERYGYYTKGEIK